MVAKIAFTFLTYSSLTTPISTRFDPSFMSEKDIPSRAQSDLEMAATTSLCYW